MSIQKEFVWFPIRRGEPIEERFFSDPALICKCNIPNRLTGVDIARSLNSKFSLEIGHQKGRESTDRSRDDRDTAKDSILYPGPTRFQLLNIGFDVRNSGFQSSNLVLHRGLRLQESINLSRHLRDVALYVSLKR